MKKLLAIMWTAALLCCMLSEVAGVEPQWFYAYTPLTILAIDRWEEYFKSKKE